MAARTPLQDEPDWPAESQRRVVFLIDASSRLEERILRDWIERARPEGAEAEALRIPASRRRGRWRRSGRAFDARLDACVAGGDDALLAPLRIAWLPPRRDGERAVRLSDLFTLGDPRDPDALRQRFLLRRHPDRCRIVAGEPAPVKELRGRWRDAGGTDAGETTGLAEFVARQAALALERAERRLRGARYKVPRFVSEDILSRPAVRGGLARLARELDRSESSLLRDARRYLDEIAATHSPFVIDLAAHLIRWLYTRAYGEALHVARERLEQISALQQQHPVVFLPTHKSNLDHLVLQYMLYESGLPPNHTAGGINMNFFPVGPLVRRTGVFFIRRSFRDNPTYKFVLRQYIDYLVAKRFSLEWYIEGGRSRSGKLLPPRYGMLAYVVEAFRRGKAEDVWLCPVSIIYDQIQEVGEYADEQRGAAKEAESFGWFVRVIRGLRSRRGDIHIRFGEPVSLAKAIGQRGSLDLGEEDADDPGLAVRKLAFEVAVRINRVTPITPVAAVTLAMLGTGDRALTLAEVRRVLAPVQTVIRLRELPTTHELETLETAEGVRRVLGALCDSGVVSCFDEGPEAVYAIPSERHLEAAYYRNSVCHFFVNGAIAELSLLRAAESGVRDPGAEFWAEAMRLRDLLKFEFFFAEKDEFRRELREELTLYDPDWEPGLAEGVPAVGRTLRTMDPLAAHSVLRPFLEAYLLVADALVRHDAAKPLDEGPFLDECLALGKQYRLMRRVRSPESISKVLFATALRLARNRGLVEAGQVAPLAERRAFSDEIADVVRRIEAVEALAAARRTGALGWAAGEQGTP